MIREISVIIPTYNRRDRIVKAVESVLNQTYPIREVIIADDCSSDDTEDVIKNIDDPRIKYYRLPENRGAGGARNFGVVRAQCDIIAFHDSDDIWLPEKIERQMEVFEKEPEDGLVYSAYLMKLILGILHVMPQEDGTRNLSGQMFRDLLIRNSIGAPTILMKKDIFWEVGGFDENLRSLEDWDFVIRVAEKYPIGFVKDCLMEVERLEGGVSANHSAYYQSRCYMIRKYRKQYLEQGLFNFVVEGLLQEAQENQVLQQVQQMLVHYLSV